jgi:hypothetical protein
MIARRSAFGPGRVFSCGSTTPRENSSSARLSSTPSRVFVEPSGSMNVCW